MNRCDGFTLLEVVLALAILATGVVSAAQVIALGTRSTDSARSATMASILAGQKMEQLRALAWGYQADGTETTDVSTDAAGETAAAQGGTGLCRSPQGTLETNVEGFVDYLDGAGGWVGAGSTPPSAAEYIRRWSIEPLAAETRDTLVLEVVVFRRVAGNSRAEPASAGMFDPEEARIVGLKTRRAN